MIVIGPGILMRAGIREGLVVGSRSRSGSISRGPKRGNLPFEVERSAYAVEETAAAIERAKASRRRIERGKAGNSSAHAASRDTSIDRTAGIAPTVFSNISRR